jgi:hypothetical protein
MPSSNTCEAPIHSSARTSTSLNTGATGEQFLTVVTTRLVMHWARNDVVVRFEMQRVRTAVLGRDAANDRRRGRMR